MQFLIQPRRIHPPPLPLAPLTTQTPSKPRNHREAPILSALSRALLSSALIGATPGDPRALTPTVVLIPPAPAPVAVPVALTYVLLAPRGWVEGAVR